MSDLNEQDKCILHVANTKNDYGNYVKLTQSRFDDILQLKKLRLSLPPGDPKRKVTVCNQIPNEFSNDLGYHTVCYKYFSSHKNNIKRNAEEEATAKQPPRKKPQNPIIFGPECIFCKKSGPKNSKKYSRRKEETSKFHFGGGQNIINHANAINDVDLLRTINNRDLFACEAQYHRSCHRKYLSKTTKHWESKDEGKFTFYTFFAKARK